MVCWKVLAPRNQFLEMINYKLSYLLFSQELLLSACSDNSRKQPRGKSAASNTSDALHHLVLDFHVGLSS